MSSIKNLLFDIKSNFLFSKGFKDKSITPFDDTFYDKLKTHFFNCIPVYIHIKYLLPQYGPGKCYDRSMLMFLCFDDAVLVRGDMKSLEVKYGKEQSGHGWIEIGDDVYDPTSLCKYKKDLYYKLNGVTNVTKCNKEEFIKTCDAPFFLDIMNSTIDDYKVDGKHRHDLATSIPLMKKIAKNTTNEDFINDLDEYLVQIEYDEEQVFNDLDNKFKRLFKRK